MRKLLLAVSIPVVLFSQGLTNSMLLKPPVDSWPTYNGDYSSKRYSTLTQINSANVHTLSLAWAARYTTTNGTVVIKAAPLLVNGVIYFTSPNNAWAVDARSGRSIWQYTYPPNTGSTIGQRGVGIYGNWVYFETPDSHLVSVDAKTGKERWKVQLADPKLDYTSTAAPIVVGNHILVGIGGDHIDNPGFLESRDPETGAVQWRFNTTPRKGEPGIETWPNEEAAIHGTGQTWIPGSYDPETKLYIIGTGNPNPVMADKNRKGDNLYTCTIVAINVDTGKLAWHYQVSPHDVHDWDANEAPILFDGVINGVPRKLVAQASRNGYFFVLDRVTGKHISTTPMIDTLNWAKINDKGQPVPLEEKYPRTDGTLVSPASGGVTNWYSPSYSPQTGLFYVGINTDYSMYYLTDTDDNPQAWAGLDSGAGGFGGSLIAIDYKTGKSVWRHPWPSGSGFAHILTTAGNLLFTSNGPNLIAFQPRTGKILWHSTLMANPSGAMITYMLDGKQYLLVPAGDSMYAFTVNQPVR